MSIYIRTVVRNLKCAQHTNIVWKGVFSVTAEKCSQSHLLTRLEANSRRLVQRQRTTDSRVLFVDSAVHPAGDGVLSAVSDDQRYPRQRNNSLSGTLALCCSYTGGLWWRAWTGLDLPHRTSASRYVAAAIVHGRTCAAARSTHEACSGMKYPLPAVCQWQTSVHQRVPCCSSPPGLWQKRGQVSVDSSSSDRLTRRSWWSCTNAGNMFIQADVGRKDHAEHANMVRRRDSIRINVQHVQGSKPVLHSDCLYFEPSQSSSFLSGFSLRQFADIQWMISTRHRSSRTTVGDISSRRQWRYNCVSSANTWIFTLCFWTTSARSVLYKMKRRRPRTDPCGTEQTIWIIVDMEWPKMICLVDMSGTQVRYRECRTVCRVAQDGALAAYDRQ